jgi:hypothetical protein
VAVADEGDMTGQVGREVILESVAVGHDCTILGTTAEVAVKAVK